MRSLFLDWRNNPRPDARWISASHSFSERCFAVIVVAIPIAITIATVNLARSAAPEQAGVPVAPQTFRQESSLAFTTANGLASDDVRFITVDAAGAPVAFAGGVWHRLDGDQWRPVPAGPGGPGDRLPLPFTDEWLPVAAGDVVQWITSGSPGRVTAIVTGNAILVRETGGAFASPSPGPPGTIRQAARSPDGIWHVGTTKGLFRAAGGGEWVRLPVLDDSGRDWTAGEVLGLDWDSRGRLWLASRAGAARSTPDGWEFFEGKEGLPWNGFTCVAAGASGEVWFGTRLGVIRFEDGDWHYRQGPRWLPDDAVRQIAVTPSGDAWIATAGGVGLIQRLEMSLAAKAEYYESEIERHIKRTRFGYVSEARLRVPGDRETAEPGDSDNDGLWTAMYGAGECFAHAATADERALARAKAAFEALRFLQKVTENGPHSPPKGYVARTIRSTDPPDPNRGRLESDRRFQAERDRLWKVYEPRWPKSADGRWFWKSDTSSDELDGHYFFYGLYHEHCAKTDSEKERVREVVRDLTNHLLEHDFVLMEHDGRPTRWAIYRPAMLNGDPDWWVERGLNSLSILSYLAVAERVTGETRYADAARELIENHHYDQNLMYPKAQSGVGSGNQSDDEMAFMCFYNLLRYSRDEDLKRKALAAFYRYWTWEQPERNPFFHFAYAAHGLGATGQTPWQTFSLAPWDGWHRDAVDTLYGFPLDRRNWSHRNSHRLDLIRLPRQQSRDPLVSGDNSHRGHRVDGRVLPVENRHFGHWNTDPWHLDYGGNGNELASGTVFLLPYYMGLYHGFIEKPGPN